MYKKRKIDFILNERRGYRLIFRFYPKRSSCHSFNENPPKSWNEVYKVYYSYAILEEYDDLSVNDRVSILLEMIEKIIK